MYICVLICNCIYIECIYVCLFVIAFIWNVADVFICDCINIECIYVCLFVIAFILNVYMCVYL